MKNNTKNTEKRLYATYGCAFDDYDYEFYVEHCEINEIEPDKEDSQSYWDWVSDTQTMFLDDLMENLKHSKSATGNYMIGFSLGLWNGTEKGFLHKVYNSLASAIEDCVTSTRGGYDDIEIVWYDGVVECRCHHHDGCNVFTIQRLSAHGERSSLMNDSYSAGDASYKAFNTKRNFKRIRMEDLW